MKIMIGVIPLVLLVGCSTATYPYGVGVTPPAELPVSYGSPNYPAPVAPVAPDYYAVGGGYYPVYGYGCGWGAWGNWGWNHCNWAAGNSGCHPNNGYASYGANGYRGCAVNYGGYYLGSSGYAYRH